MTIEELESQFIPCDITPDMYDTDVDDSDNVDPDVPEDGR